MNFMPSEKRVITMLVGAGLARTALKKLEKKEEHITVIPYAKTSDYYDFLHVDFPVFLHALIQCHFSVNFAGNHI